jgi:hypothetical protein
MKASEMICLLAKQIEMNGDREVMFVGGRDEACFPSSDTEYKILSVSSIGKRIEIYGE